MKSVYSAVRTGSLSTAVCASSLKPTGHVMHHQFNNQQLYVLSTLYFLIGFYNRDEKCLQRGMDWVFKYSGMRFVFKAYQSRDAPPV